MSATQQINPLEVASDGDTGAVDVAIGAIQEQQTKSAPPGIPETLPVLGVADFVVFPGQVVPLLVDSPDGVQLVDDVASGNRMFAAVLQRNPNVQTPAPDDLYRVGCAVRLLRMLKGPENTARILVQGICRLSINRFVTTTPYLVAEVESLQDVEEDSVELQALARNAQLIFQEIIQLSPTLTDQEKMINVSELRPGQLADLIAHSLNMELTERQRLLETASVRSRLESLLPLLNREHQILKLTLKIQSEVANTFSKTQRDYFLREQLRVIQRELGETDALTAELKQLSERVESVRMPAEARTVARQELDRLKQMTPATPEYAITRGYLDWILAIPWEAETPDRLDLREAERILDRDHYGLVKVKERLLEFLAVLQLRRQIKGPILCLVGPPGVGKTSLGRSVAEALGRKFARISLGGIRDEAEIRGHRRTYVGAMPGRIIQTLRRLEARNPVIMLDELDKIGADFRGDPAAALLEVLDPEQNHAFLDHYLDIPFDLSRVLFIATANWLDPVHPALRDRLEVIELPSYSESEKLQIARRYLIPRQTAEHGLKRGQVRITTGTISRLIRHYTREAGVRQLEREIAALLRKASRRIISSGGNTGPIVFKPEQLPELLGHPRYTDTDARRSRDRGVALGLAWTPYGGEVLHIEACRMPGTGKLILTGSLGEILKESAQIAVSYLRSHGPEIGVVFGDHHQSDLHVHIPAGATPKDGPSAGLAILVALASLLKNRPVGMHAALTGEITLRGKVLKVGGIKEKVLAAAGAGIPHVILPAGNRHEWEDLPADAKRKTKPWFVESAEETLKLLFPKK